MSQRALFRGALLVVLAVAAIAPAGPADPARPLARYLLEHLPTGPRPQ